MLYLLVFYCSEIRSKKFEIPAKKKYFSIFENFELLDQIANK